MPQATKYDFQDDQIIRITTPENPKVPHTAAFHKFDLLMKFHGKPVDAFCVEADRRMDLGMVSEKRDHKSWWRSELNYCVDKGFVKLVG